MKSKQMEIDGVERDLHLIRYKEAAALLRLKVSTLYSMVSRREIPHLRLAKRIVRFDRRELSRWILAKRIPAGHSDGR